jgi:hypothetical protein
LITPLLWRAPIANTACTKFRHSELSYPSDGHQRMLTSVSCKGWTSCRARPQSTKREVAARGSINGAIRFCRSIVKAPRPPGLLRGLDSHHVDVDAAVQLPNLHPAELRPLREQVVRSLLGLHVVAAVDHLDRGDLVAAVEEMASERIFAVCFPAPMLRRFAKGICPLVGEVACGSVKDPVDKRRNSRPEAASAASSRTHPCLWRACRAQH